MSTSDTARARGREGGRAEGSPSVSVSASSRILIGNIWLISSAGRVRMRLDQISTALLSLNLFFSTSNFPPSASLEMRLEPCLRLVATCWLTLFTSSLFSRAASPGPCSWAAKCLTSCRLVSLPPFETKRSMISSGPRYSDISRQEIILFLIQSFYGD